MSFNDLAIVISLASLLGMIAIWMKQPSILGYIVAGFLLSLFGSVGTESMEIMDSLASIGIALLLFLVGLEMNFDKIKSLGKDIIIIGTAQTVGSVAFGFIVLQALGVGIIASIYLAMAFSFSSTIIVIKLLSEKKDLSSLYGRIVLGIMIFEDFIAILMLIFLEGLGSSGSFSGMAADFGITMLKGAALIAVAIAVSKIMPKVLDAIGTKAEALFLFSIAWGIGIAAVVSTKQVGLGIEAGGFLAGLALAKSAEHYEVSSQVKWLRDFFIVMFFVILGSKMALGGSVGNIIIPGIILSAMVLIANPLITILSMKIMGHSGKTAFFVGLTTAQISEFSLVVVARGGELGHLTAEQINLVTIVGIITIVISSLMIMNADALWKIVKPLMRDKRMEESVKKKDFPKGHVVLIGARRIGQGIINALQDSKKSFSVVDIDPQVVRCLTESGIKVFQGDGVDEDILENAGLRSASLVISTAPLIEDNAAIIRCVKRENKEAEIIVTADSDREGRELYEMGADFVIMPHFMGGEHIGEILRKRSWRQDFSLMKKKDEKAFLGCK
ncbi:MAG: cation:proton antiporter [Candidatus Colwellbacteria bacterium]|nr:cation:proton antiporter [Candidatus Colwellbacteria bacterium]